MGIVNLLSSEQKISRIKTEKPYTHNNEIGEDSPPEQVIPWSLDIFSGKRIIMTTSFGMEGCALIDMYFKAMQDSEKWSNRKMEIVYLDTMFFFPETQELRKQLEERYPNMNFVNRGTTLNPEEQERRYGPELWKHRPDLCCKLRKVDPLDSIMRENDVWITGLRRSQSATRAHLRVLDVDSRFGIIKVNPLATLERSDIWGYIKECNVPYNKLHEQGYPTIGCTHCTVPVPGSTPREYSRAGRWPSSEMTDCGLHGDI